MKRQEDTKQKIQSSWVNILSPKTSASYFGQHDMDKNDIFFKEVIFFSFTDT